MNDTNKRRRVLIVDDSRVVRATLSKHLRGDFEIREEADGESAWQTLMLDASLCAVISGIHTPRLSAHDLLARLKASPMRRLREIPFVLITSDIDNKVERDFDRTLGVDGFISKSMGKTELVDYLKNLLDSAVFTESVILPDVPKEEEEEPPAPQEPMPVEPALEPVFKQQTVLDPEPFRELIAASPIPKLRAGKVCVLVFGIDNRDSLISSFGEEAMDMVVRRIASLLVTKVGPSDSIGRCEGDRLAIVSQGVDLDQGVHFAQRVCKSLASGQITIRGQKIRLTASVGVASNSGDPTSDGPSLLAQAEKRLDQALICGGNTVASENKSACPMHRQDFTAARLLDALNLQGPESVAENIGMLGLKIMPILEIMNRELSLGLPLDDIRQQLKLREKSKAAG